MTLDESAARVCVYVPLIAGEGGLRPVPAELLSPLVARLLVPTDYDAGREQWQFAPGTTVRLARRLVEGEEVLVATGPLPLSDSALHDRDR